jgi:hypothetical protein
MYVALDARARTYWRFAPSGEAWELTCLHSHLDPHALREAPLCFWSGEDPKWWDKFGRLKPPPRDLRRIELRRNLGKVRAAINSGELSTLPLSEEERQLGMGEPLTKRVRLDVFVDWTKRVGLQPTAPWPERAIDGPRERGRIPPLERLELTICNPIQMLAKHVAAHFRARYAAGGRETPTTEEVARYLVQDLGEPPNRKQAAAIAAFLRPADTPHGPRHGRDRPF